MSASEASMLMHSINTAPRSAVVVRVLSPAPAQPWSCLRSLIQAPSAAPLVSGAHRDTMAPRLDLQLSLRVSTSLDGLPTHERSLARPARRKRRRASVPFLALEFVCASSNVFRREKAGSSRADPPSASGALICDTVYSERHMEPPLRPTAVRLGVSGGPPVRWLIIFHDLSL